MPVPVLSPRLKKLLKSTSRAFYLSLVVLPPASRDLLSLAYLYARLADTVADSSVRQDFDKTLTLKELIGALTDADSRLGAKLARLEVEHPGEKDLLAHFGLLLEAIDSLPNHEKAEAVKVLETLIEGMIWDQSLFSEAKEECGLSDQEWERYTYLVAGCVGPFWSFACRELFLKEVQPFSDPAQKIAVEFGKGLQWVNILRDLDRDFENGRFYLPAKHSPHFLSRFSKASARALQALEQARTYLTFFPWWRPLARFSVFLPMVLAYRTLEKLWSQDPLKSSLAAKVPRSEVFIWLGAGLVLCMNNSLLEKCLQALARRADQACRDWRTKHGLP